MNIDVKIKEEATHWLTCEKEGWSAFEKEAFERWLAQNPLHVKAYQRIKSIYALSLSMPQEYVDALRKQAHAEARTIKRFAPMRSFARVAAVFLLMGASLFGIYDHFFALKFAHDFNADVTPLTKQVLPDGSIISCDAKTQMRVAFYTTKRVVTLTKGAAMFEVAKDAKRVFIIHSDNVSIEVVGTKFEVQRTDDATTINVQEGTVKTAYEASWHEKKHEKLLSKADSITYAHEGTVEHYAKINPEKIALWRDNRINFNQVNLKQAMEMFSKYTDVSYTFATPDIEAYVITGEFALTQLDIFLQTLSKIYPLKIVKNDEKIEFSKKVKK